MILAVVLMANFVGCASYRHTQAVRNETGAVAARVYSRDTGTTSWGNMINVRARTDAHGNVIRTPEGAVRFWDVFHLNSGAQHNIFSEISSSATPTRRNQDLRMIDNHGVKYTIYNVPIEATTYHYGFLAALGWGRPNRINNASPITFTAQDRHPLLFIQDQTGRSVDITAPARTVRNLSNAWWQLPELNQSQNVTVTYTIGRFQFSEQVYISNEDVTLTLTRRPPVVVIRNNTGHTAASISIRATGDGALAWIDILSPGGGITTVARTVISGDNFSVNLERLPLTGDRFDFRLVHVATGQEHIMSNIHIPNDVTLTFTAAHRH